MKQLLTALAVTCIALFGTLHAGNPVNQCATESGHKYGPWFKQDQMFYIPEQAAHVCSVCGEFQNASGRFTQLVKSGPDGIAGGLGTLTKDEALAQVNREILGTFGTWAAYKAAPARNGYGGK